MSTPILCLLLFAAWAIVLVLTLDHNLAVNARFTAFCVQLGGFVWMIVEILRRS